MDDSTHKILWISDIHSAEKDYKKKEVLLDESLNIKYYKGFINEIDKIINEKKIIYDYIIISGDLVFSGKKESYDYFSEHILNELQKKYNASIILICPGNHDVDLDQIDLKNSVENKKFNEFLDSFNDDKNLGEPEFVQRNEEFLTKNFTDYSAFFKNAEIFDRLKSNRFEVSDSYENGLYGIVKDKEKKIAFVIINTAWLSLGYNFEKIIKENFNLKLKAYDLIHKKKADKKSEESEKKEVNPVLSAYEQGIKDIKKTREYGKQTMGLSLFNNKGDDPVKNNSTSLYKDLINEEKFSDYFVITIMHHPFAWIRETEKFSYNSLYDTENELPFTKILKKTDLLLTGHEHLLVNNSIKYIDNIVHLEAGKLLDVDNTFFNNRFSILELSLDNFENKEFKPYLKDYRFYTEPKSVGATKDWIWKEYHKMKPKIELKKFADKKDYFLGDRIERLDESIKNKIDNTNLAKYLNNKLYKANEIINLEYREKISDFKLFGNIKKKILVQFYVGNNFIQSKIFDCIKNSESYNEVITVVPDFLSGFKDDLFAVYNGSNYETRALKYLDISNDLDVFFNKKRNDYFNPKTDDKEAPTKNKNIKFVINTLSYWDLEKYFH